MIKANIILIFNTDMGILPKLCSFLGCFLFFLNSYSKKKSMLKVQPLQCNTNLLILDRKQLNKMMNL